MKVKSRIIEDEVYESVNENGNTALIDMRSAELKQNQSPVEMLLSALNACAAVDVVLMLRKKRKTIKNLEIEADGERNEEPPRYFKKIHCHFVLESPDTSKEDLYKVTKLAVEKYCSVASSLKSEVTFSVEVKN
ncbi:MAG TPA: OsmC family protein [Cyclobacteriaceae bacterium]|nr:OsmC family protein [Cyclobacteriaceae bacterium]